MSAFGPKQTSAIAPHMSAFDPKRTFGAVGIRAYLICPQFIEATFLMFSTSHLMLDILVRPAQTLESTFATSRKIDMITGAQMRAARALLGIDQRELAQRSGLSLPTIQRMEASNGVVRGNVDSLMKLVDALAANGIELIAEGATSSTGGRGVRLK
jgi:DNA-binding transcriptional regulator YiaG